MSKKSRYQRHAEKLANFKVKNVTISYSYFVRKVLGYRPPLYFILLTGIIYFWVPQSHYRSQTIYMPRIYLCSRRLFTGFLVHEILHQRFPYLYEHEIESVSRERMHHYH